MDICIIFILVVYYSCGWSVASGSPPFDFRATRILNAELFNKKKRALPFG